MTTSLADLPASPSVQELRAYDPTWRDQIAYWLMTRGPGGTGDRPGYQPSLAREAFVDGVMGSTGLGQTGFGLADLTPVGIVLGVQEALKAGDYKAAALNLVPGAYAVRAGGGAARRGVANLIDAALGKRPATGSALGPESVVMYNPPPKSQRPFAADYPGGLHGEKRSELAVDIEGRPLVVGRVAGRRTLGGADEALTPAELDAGAAAILGDQPKSVAESTLPRKAIGVYSVGGGSERPVRSIEILNSLDPVARHRVLAHETGHLIDDVAGKTVGFDAHGEIRAIPQDGIEKELWRIYHDLNDETRRGVVTPRRLQTRPETFGYTADEAPAEYMAEAIRAYLADPNYIKTVAPETAKRIRQYVNSNPLLNKQIQFNSAVPAAAAGALGYAASQAQEDGQ